MMAQLLTEHSLEAAKHEDYLVYTRDFDVHEVMPVNPALMPFYERTVGEIEAAVSNMVGLMQKDLERAIAAKSNVVWNGGRRDGFLDPGALTQLILGDDRVFQERIEHTSKDVAVQLAVDVSGSMNILNKCWTAVVSAFALAQTLERIGIPSQVTCFTTLDPDITYGSLAKRAAVREEMARLGRGFSRIDAIRTMQLKGFHERMTSEVKVRFAAVLESSHHQCNVDGEAIEYMARQLLQRREKGKVMIVLSDGNPAVEQGEDRDCRAHLVRTVQEIIAHGIKVAAIGIADASVRRYYPQHAVIHEVAQLPETVMTRLRSMLL